MYQQVVRLGVNGIVARLLRGPLSEILVSKSPDDQLRAGGLFALVEGYGLDRRGNVRLGRRVPWREVYDRLTSLPNIDENIAMRIRLECDLFDRLGFRGQWCRHAHHIFITDDRRTLDCPEHYHDQRAAQKRRKRTQRRVNDLVSRTMGAVGTISPHGMTAEEFERRLGSTAAQRILVRLETEGIIRRETIAGKARIFRA